MGFVGGFFDLGKFYRGPSLYQPNQEERISLVKSDCLLRIKYPFLYSTQAYTKRERNTHKENDEKTMVSKRISKVHSLT